MCKIQEVGQVNTNQEQQVNASQINYMDQQNP
jgi:hypothetical protein